jgi:ATP-binding cassette subfamily A (ABC1) protein 3
VVEDKVSDSNEIE